MARIESYADALSYFRGIATANKLLNPDHLAESDRFYEFSEDTLSLSGIKYPMMLMMPDEYSFLDNMSDNIHKTFHLEFWISQSTTMNDTVGERNALAAALDLAEEILRKIRADYRTTPLTRPMAEWNINKVTITQHGVWGQDRCVGYSVKIPFSNPMKMNLSSNWW